jgi:hypothetical protein
LNLKARIMPATSLAAVAHEPLAGTDTSPLMVPTPVRRSADPGMAGCDLPTDGLRGFNARHEDRLPGPVGYLWRIGYRLRVCSGRTNQRCDRTKPDHQHSQSISARTRCFRTTRRGKTMFCPKSKARNNAFPRSQ